MWSPPKLAAAEGLQGKVNVIKTKLVRTSERLREARGEAVTNTAESATRR